MLEELREVQRPARETVDLPDALRRVLAEDVRADRDAPASTRSVRDGFAVRFIDLPGTLRVIGEVRAGESTKRTLAAGEAIEIMTGAPLPAGADGVVMVEHVRRDGDQIHVERTLKPGENLNPQGSEAKVGDTLLRMGERIGFSEISMLASVGKTTVQVYTLPQIAILATGDEVVELSQTPQSFQVRNSNTHSLAAQVRLAGGTPVILPIAPDNADALTDLILRGLVFDLLLLTGGVSAGKYDIVEPVLAELGAEFYFDRVLIQPGQPAVFGRAQGTLFFGLPGNPAATMVTFEIFARAAVERLSGVNRSELPITLARLTQDFRQKPGLTRFLPARLSPGGVDLTPIEWKGSGDIPAVTRANAFLVTDPDRSEWSAGDLIQVLLK